MPASFLHGVELLEITSGSRPIQTVSSSVIGLIGTAPQADPDVFPLNTPVRVTDLVQAAKLTANTGAGNAGTLPDAIDSIYKQAGAVVVVVRVAEGQSEALTLSNVAGGTDPTTGAYTGAWALLGARSALDLTPRILIAPGWTHQRPEDGANPVVAQLVTVAERLRAIIFADGPNTTDEAAIDAAGDWGTRRVMMLDPKVKKYVSGETVTSWPSGIWAGVTAKTDNDVGPWQSPSNQLISGITGLARPIDFSLGDATSRANLLNASNVSTIIREGGFLTWGNRTCSNDPKWQFLSVVRTADMINDSLLRAHLWAVDRAIGRNYLSEVVEGVRAYMRSLVAQGAILGGDCWADPALNTPDQIQQGRVFIDFDFTPPYPAERITFRSQLTGDYLTEIFA